MNVPRPRIFVFFLMLIGPPALAEGGSPAETVSRWYSARMAGDLAAAMSLLDTSATPRARRAAVDEIDRFCIDLESFRILREDVSAHGRARVEIAAHIRRRPRARGRSAEELERLSFELTSNAGRWQVKDLSYAEDALIDRIVENRGSAQTILAAHPDLIGERLIAQLIARALTAGLATNDGRPVRWLADLAFDVASALDDRGGIASAMALQVEHDQRVPGVNKKPFRARAEAAFEMGAEAEAYDAMALGAIALTVNIMNQDGPSQEAERIFKRILQYRASIPPARVGSLLSNYGLLLFQRQDYAASYRVFSDALTVAEHTGAEHVVAFIEYHIGWILERQNDHELAIRHFRRSTELPGPKPFLIMAHLGIARASLARAEHEAGRREAERALEIALGTPYKGLISQCHVLLAQLAIERGDVAGAEALLLKAVAFAREVGYRVPEVEALIGLGNLYLRSGRVADAVQAARDAQPRADAVEFGTWDSYAALMLAARSELAGGNTARALGYLESAIEVTEANRASVAGNERQRVLFFEPRHAAYTEMARLLLLRGGVADALLFSERAKGRVLLDVLGREISADDLMSDEDRERRGRLLARLHDANRAGLAPAQTSAQLALEAFHNDLEARDPRLAGRRGPASTIDAASIRSAVPSSDMAFLEYLVHEEFTTLFVVQSNEQAPVVAYRVDVSREELAKRVDAYVVQLARRDLRYTAASRALYDLLIAPARKELRGRRVLGIVPDGALWKLPFASLRDADGRHLIESVACFYAPSISAYREIARRRRSSKASAAGPVAAFGNPLIPSTRLEPLPDAEREAGEIARLWGKGSELFVREDATESAVKRELTRSRIVHLAAHAIFVDDNPMFSELLLAPDRESGEDGVLQPWELMRIGMAADLVVLSACETGRGRLNAGEGLIGMSWALFIGGCPSTVVAQWKIGAGTAPLMIAFHQALAAATPQAWRKARALREAQLQTLRRPSTAHPFYWAAFVLVGSPD